MIKHQYRGKLIVVSGTDGAGKTTLISGIAERMERAGSSVLLTRQPTTELRQQPLFHEYIFNPGARDTLSYQALLALMLSDRLQHQKQVIEPALKAGKVVLSDRYIFTMIASMRARGYDEPWVHTAIAHHVIRPDVGILLTAPLETVIVRIMERQTFEGSYVERDHLIASQKEYLRCAHEHRLAVIDTSKLDARAALDFAMGEIEQEVLVA